MRAKGPMENAERQAQAQLESIVAMVAAFRMAGHDGEREAAEATIRDDALSIEVRGDWHPLDTEYAEASEFKIELCTGGPAVRIVGELDRYCEPENPRVEHQDWFTPWRMLDGITEEQDDALLEYCRQFYFGD